MCGIVGIVSHDNVTPFLMSALKHMEYRGYDSAGIAIQTKANKLVRRRAKGKISALKNVVLDAPISGTAGIGHIRWATHGEPNEENAHPQASKHVMVVHNGIIENYLDIKNKLIEDGFVFSSDTDTEVVAHLIEHHLNLGKEPFIAFKDSVKTLKGAYALAVMIQQEPNTIFMAREGSPLIIGFTDDAMLVGSDALAISTKTNLVKYLENGDYGFIKNKESIIYDKNDALVERETHDTGYSQKENEKGDYEHYMLKEIHEQPSVLKRLINHYIDSDSYTVKPLNINFNINEIDRFAFIACGTAYHAGMLGKFWMEKLAKVNVDIDFASEYRYRDCPFPKKGAFIAFSQSGETADTLGALRRAKEENQHTIAIVNTSKSTMERESDDVLLTYAGAEVGVASTKAFIAQCFVILCFVIHCAKQKGLLKTDDEKELVKEIISLPNQIEALVNQKDLIIPIAHSIAPASDALFLGRSQQYPIALEAALKLKEISYIHAEGYASGEMKHGTIALIDEHLPVICLIPDDNVFEKSISNMQEVIARKARVILVSTSDVCQKYKTAQHIVMPNCNPILSPILYVIPMQLLSYYTALVLEKDIDQPRNLAKSVTVE